MPEISCPERLDSDAAEGLVDQILHHRSEDLCVDFSRVTFLGALSAQVLLAAQNQWKADKVTMKFTNISNEIQSDLTHLGLAENLKGHA